MNGAGPVLKQSSDDADLVGLRPLLSLGYFELDPLPLVEAAVAVRLDRAVVHEDVLAAVDGDEAVALLAVEPLHGALCHLLLLRGGVGARTPRAPGQAPDPCSRSPRTFRGRGLSTITGTTTGRDDTRRKASRNRPEMARKWLARRVPG